MFSKVVKRKQCSV